MRTNMEVKKEYFGTTTDNPHTSHQLWIDGERRGTVHTDRTGVVEAWLDHRNSLNVTPVPFDQYEPVNTVLTRIAELVR